MYSVGVFPNVHCGRMVWLAYDVNAHVSSWLSFRFCCYSTDLLRVCWFLCKKKENPKIKFIWNWIRTLKSNTIRSFFVLLFLGSFDEALESGYTIPDRHSIPARRNRPCNRGKHTNDAQKHEFYRSFQIICQRGRVLDEHEKKTTKEKITSKIEKEK